MRIEEKFNIKSAKLLDVLPPQVSGGIGYARDIKCEFYTAAPFEQDNRSLSLHMTPLEALEFANNLIAVARRQLA